MSKKKASWSFAVAVAVAVSALVLATLPTACDASAPEENTNNDVNGAKICSASGMKTTLRGVRVFRTCSASQADPGFNKLGITGREKDNHAVFTNFECRTVDDVPSDPTQQGYVRIDIDVEIPIHKRFSTGAQNTWCRANYFNAELTASDVSLGGINFGTQEFSIRQQLATPALRYPLKPLHFIPYDYRKLEKNRDPGPPSRADQYCNYSPELCTAAPYSAQCECPDALTGNCLAPLFNDTTLGYECFGEAVNVTGVANPASVPKGEPQPCAHPDLFGSVTGPRIPESKYLRDFQQRQFTECRILQCGRCPLAFTGETRQFSSYKLPNGAIFEPDLTSINMPGPINGVNGSIVRNSGTLQVWIWLYDSNTPLTTTAGAMWAYLHLSVDPAPLMVFGIQVFTTRGGVWLPLRTRNKGNCLVPTTNWEDTGLCTGNSEGPIRACDCAQFPSMLEDGRGIVTENENLPSQDFTTEIDGAPTVGGSLIVRTDVNVASFDYVETTTDGGYSGSVFTTTDWGWDDGNSAACQNTVSSGKVCRITENPRDRLLGNLTDRIPTRWFHGYNLRRRLHVGQAAGEWGSHPNSIPNIWEEGNDRYSPLSKWNQAQEMCARRTGSYIPGTDYWSPELGDRSVVVDQPECGFRVDGSAIIENCTSITPGIGSAPWMKQFLDENGDIVNSTVRPKHLPPRTFENLQYPDAWIGFDQMTTMDSIDDDQAVPYISGAPIGAKYAPYLFIDYSDNSAAAQPLLKRRMTYRIPAHLLRPTVTTISGEIGYPPSGPPSENALPATTEVVLQVTNQGSLGGAFDVVLDCGNYADVIDSTVATSAIVAPSESTTVRFVILPRQPTTATNATCTAVLFGNTGQQVGAPFIVEVQNSKVVTLPPLPPTSPPITVPPTRTATPLPTTLVLGKVACFLNFWCSAPDWVKAMLVIGLPFAIGMLILYSCLIANKDPTKEQLAREADDRVTRNLPRQSFSTPVDMTPQLASNTRDITNSVRELTSLKAMPHSNLRQRQTLARRIIMGQNGGGFYGRQQ